MRLARHSIMSPYKTIKMEKWKATWCLTCRVNGATIRYRNLPLSLSWYFSPCSSWDFSLWAWRSFVFPFFSSPSFLFGERWFILSERNPWLVLYRVERALLWIFISTFFFVFLFSSQGREWWRGHARRNLREWREKRANGWRLAFHLRHSFVSLSLSWAHDEWELFYFLIIFTRSNAVNPSWNKKEKCSEIKKKRIYLF